MKERSAKIEYDQDTVDFWSALYNQYGCIKLYFGLSENHEDFSCLIQTSTSSTNGGVPTNYGLPINSVLLKDVVPTNGYDETKFCMNQPLSFSENCYPMCNLIQNCEIHNNFLCPDDGIKPLMIACCSLWNNAFECVSSTSQPTELTTKLPTEKNNVLVYILPVASILLASVIILGIFCIVKRFRKTTSNYKTSETPQT